MRCRLSPRYLRLRRSPASSDSQPMPSARCLGTSLAHRHGRLLRLTATRAIAFRRVLAIRRAGTGLLAAAEHSVGPPARIAPPAAGRAGSWASVAAALGRIRPAADPIAGRPRRPARRPQPGRLAGPRTGPPPPRRSLGALARGAGDSRLTGGIPWCGWPAVVCAKPRNSVATPGWSGHSAARRAYADALVDTADFLSRARPSCRRWRAGWARSANWRRGSS